MVLCSRGFRRFVPASIQAKRQLAHIGGAPTRGGVLTWAAWRCHRQALALRATHLHTENHKAKTGLHAIRETDHLTGRGEEATGTMTARVIVNVIVIATASETTGNTATVATVRATTTVESASQPRTQRERSRAKS